MHDKDCNNCIWYTGTHCERKQSRITETDTEDCDYYQKPDRY